MMEGGDDQLGVVCVVAQKTEGVGFDLKAAGLVERMLGQGDALINEFQIIEIGSWHPVQCRSRKVAYTSPGKTAIHDQHLAG